MNSSFKRSSMADTEEKPKYKMPQHLKSTGNLLLKAASEGERTFLKGQIGGRIIDDFVNEIHFAIRRLLESHENILAAYSKMFDQINHGSPTDVYRAIGRLDGAIAGLEDVNKLALSYELKYPARQGFEQSGIELLRATIASILKYSIEFEKNLGQQLVDAERSVNEHPESLQGRTLPITMNFDGTQINDKLGALINWFQSYKCASVPHVDMSEPVVRNNESIDPLDAAVVGFVMGSHR